MADEQKVQFQVAAEVPLPLRIRVGAPKEGVPASREFTTRGPHECTADEWARLQKRTVGVAVTEQRPDGQKVIVGRKTIPAFEAAGSGGFRAAAHSEQHGAAAAEEAGGLASKVRMFRGKKDSGEEEKSE
jgi:hypothetical protein